MVFFAVFLTLISGIWLIAKQSTATPLKPYILIWLAAYSISVYFSIDPRRSLNQMFLMLVGVFLFLLTYDLISRGWKVEYFFKAFFLIGITITAFSLYEAGSWYLRWIRNNPGNWFPDITYRLGTGNLLPPFLILTFHIGIPIFSKTSKKLHRVIILLLVFLSMVVLYLTSSRGGWLGLFFGLLVWGVYFFKTAKEFIITNLKKLFTHKLLFIGIVLLLISLMVLGGFLLYKQTVHPTHGSVFSARDGYWGPAIDTFLEHPLFGQGQFTFASSFLRENSTPPNTFHQHAHSLYLNLLAEMGFVGLLAALLFMVMYFLKFRSIFQKSNDKLVLLSIFAFIVSCGVHNIFDAYHTKPAMLWPLAILAGAAISQPFVSTSDPRKPRPWGMMILISFTWFGIWAITPYYHGFELANQNQWKEAYQTFGQAVKRDPGNALAHQQLALTAAVLAQDGEQNMLDIAIQELESTIQLEPSWALNHANLSTLYFEKNEKDQAIQSAQKAVALAPAVPLYFLNSGYLLEKAGEKDQAHLAYIKTLDLNPDWSTASFWMETSLGKETLNRWIKTQPTQTSLNLSDAQEILNVNVQYSWAHNVMAKAQLDSGDLESARQSLENAGLAYVNTSIDLLETQWLWAEYYRQTGDMEKAIEIGKETIHRYTQYGVFGPGTFGSLQYAPNMFRLSAMALEIVPQMVDVPISNVWSKREDALQEWR
jgi:tetratricopeptide (TPR) repeat protein